MNSTLISIGLPTYNRCEYLSKSIESVLSQSYRNIELIISDNNSQDGTAKLLNNVTDSRVRILRQPENVGMTGNWNQCLSAANGEFFLLLSDDDLLEPNAIEMMVAGLESMGAERDRVGMVRGRVKVIDEIGAIVRTTPPRGESVEPGGETILSFFNREEMMVPCCLMLRTEVLKDDGGYAGQLFPLAADTFAWVSVVLNRYLAIRTNSIVCAYRVHGSNMTKQVGVDAWVSDIRRLLDTIETTLITQGEADFATEIRKTGESYLSNVVSAIIVQHCRGGQSRASTLREFHQYKEHFLRRGGLKPFIVGLLRMVVPALIEQRLRGAWAELRA